MACSCSTQDKDYFYAHPHHLQKILQNCPGKEPRLVSCKQLKIIANKMNQLGYELRSHPQKFGIKIIALQEKIIKQENKLKNQPKNTNLKNALQENRQTLKERLAVVRWLESPGG